MSSGAAPGSPPRPTAADVAALAGVSQPTVSLVLAGKATGRVSARTQERILDACKKLGYQPNAAARQLRQGRSNTIGMFVPALGFQFFAHVLEGVQSVAIRRGFTVVVGVTDNDHDRQDQLSRVLGAQELDGLLLCAVAEPTPDAIARFTDRLVALENLPAGVPAVCFDHQATAGTVVDHLMGLGHVEIAHLGGMQDKTTYALAREAYRATLAHRGMTVTAGEVANISVAAATNAAHPLLARRPRPTAIICDDATIAAGVYQAAEDLGLRIPADLSVVSATHDDWAAVLRPSLTTVSLPSVELGVRGAELLLARLSGAQTELRTVLPTSLVVRNSTAAGPGPASGGPAGHEAASRNGDGR
ncbi:MAG: LacI family DNA-binding transcriptional regulator [Frankia sp.]